MQTYDLIMLLVLVGATLFGFWKGMAWQIASLASLVVSYFAALRFSTQLAPYFGEHAPLNRIGAMLAIYIATSFIIWTVFRLVSKIIDKVRLESFDRQLGGLLGLAKGVLLCVAITFFAVALLPPAQGQAIVNTRSGRYIVVLLNKTQAVVPPELQPAINPYLDTIEQQLGGSQPPQGKNLQQLWPPADTPTTADPALAPQSDPFAWPSTPLTPPSPWSAQSQSTQSNLPQTAWPSSPLAPPSTAWPTDSQPSTSSSDLYHSTR